VRIIAAAFGGSILHSHKPSETELVDEAEMR
jgi:hypothetical protein